MAQVAVVAMSQLWGALGLILAVPLVASAKIILTSLSRFADCPTGLAIDEFHCRSFMLKAELPLSGLLRAEAGTLFFGPTRLAVVAITSRE